MITRPKARRFRLRLSDASTHRPAAPANGDASSGLAAPRATATTPPASERATAPRDSLRAQPADDGVFEPPPATARSAPAQGTGSTPPAHGADVELSVAAEADLEQLRAEGLTGRQLRLAMRVAQRHGIKASSGLEAVRMLRQRGIDPFGQAALMDIIRNREGGGGTGRELALTSQPPLPRAMRQPGGMPAVPPPPPEARAAEVARVRAEIAQRRRRRMLLLATRLSVFVMLPTILAAWYFFMIATPLYATNSEFVIQQADSATSQGGGLGGLLGGGGGLGSIQDSVTVQSFLQSREAMRRLDETEGFKAHFSNPEIDPLRRLAPDATDEAAYRLYRRHVLISFDPTEGIIKMEVSATNPETSERFARALIAFAEEQVDQLTQRLRENQMRDAMESFERAEDRTFAAQMRVLELQERFQVLNSEVEVSLLTQQITTLESQLNQERLTLEDLRANTRPNLARVAQVDRRIAALEAQIGALRSSLTQGGADGTSLARIQRELVMAEADVATRQMLLAQAMQQLESSRIEANRQVRYLSMGVSPIAPDEAAYPRSFANTALAFLSFAGIYLIFSMTASILREQVTG
jgi:capsular polysaccharide transport system permease protein